jgi:putative intracellular protease/amidase
MAAEKVLFVLTSHGSLGDTGRPTGSYVPEIAHPAKVFTDAGFGVDFVSIAGGRPPLDGIDPDDAVTQSFLADPAIAQKIATTPTAAEVDPASYQVIYFAGGHGTMWDFPTARDAGALAGQIYAAGGVVAAVCHGPAALLAITGPDGEPLVAGKAVSSFTNAEEVAVGLNGVVPFALESALVAQGAVHQSGPDFAEFAVADGRLVTGQNPASAARVAELALEVLGRAADHHRPSVRA